MSLVKIKGKYQCNVHNIECQFCKNNRTGQYFLKCPCDSAFNCGTVTISEDDTLHYEPYTPNYDNAMVDYVRGLIDKDDEDDKW